MRFFKLSVVAVDALFVSAAVVVVIMAATAFGQQPQGSRFPRYPNELPHYRFYSTARWRVLVPAESTMTDVRKVLGDPDEANDIAAYTKPYPGDSAARQPVFTYEHVMPGWDVLVYFTRYCNREHPPDANGDRLCSIDLIPKKRISFAAVKFPAVFIKRHVTAMDALWDEYADGTGLRYEVYTAKPQYGKEVAGDLNRISYGPPEKPTSAPETWWQR